MTTHDKRRADFEEWMKAQGLESEWQPERNAYSHFTAHFAWNAWCAALDGLVIEMPPNLTQGDDYADGWNHAMVMASGAIGMAGVRVKT